MGAGDSMIDSKSSSRTTRGTRKNEQIKVILGKSVYENVMYGPSQVQNDYYKDTRGPIISPQGCKNNKGESQNPVLHIDI